MKRLGSGKVSPSVKYSKDSAGVVELQIPKEEPKRKDCNGVIPASSLRHGTSLQTVTTQLSEGSATSSPNGRDGVSTNNHSMASLNKSKRLPSESCVEEVGGRCNLSSRSRSQSRDEQGKPYTISHSQVV